MLKNQPEADFIFCDFKNPVHCRQLIRLINHYMTDPMGGSEKLNKEQEQALIRGLANHPSSFVLFILYEAHFSGLATCFINFSTFKAKPYINVHDVIIDNKNRGKGLGKMLLGKIISIATERNYCKVNLEVRDDNTVAKNLYQSLGFTDTDPMMHFWTKSIL